MIDGQIIIGFCGYAGVGKDAAADHLVSKYGFTKFRFADKVKESLYILNPYIDWPPLENLGVMRLAAAVDEFGWDEVKRTSKEGRRLQQFLATEVVRNIIDKNAWINAIKDKVYNADKAVIADVRMPNEADWLQYNMEGYLIHIQRPGVMPSNNHSSDTSVDLLDPIFRITNEGSLEQLYQKVDELMERINEDRS